MKSMIRCIILLSSSITIFDQCRRVTTTKYLYHRIGIFSEINKVQTQIYQKPKEFYIQAEAVTKLLASFCCHSEVTQS